ncbi:MAG: tetratricopeptide repeat protein [Myxococcota bacterium]
MGVGRPVDSGLVAALHIEMVGASGSLAALAATVRAHPHDPNAWADYGFALLDTGQTDQSLQCLRHAAQLAQAHPAILTRISGAFEQAGALSEALAWGRRAVQLPGVPPEAAALVGRLLTRMKDPTAAVLTLKVAIGKFPNAVALRVAIAHALLTANRASEARPHIAAALQVAPNDPTVHRLNVRLQEKLGDHSAYLNALQHLASLDESDVSAAITLGTQMAKQGRAQEAREMLAGVSARTPKTAANQLMLAMGFRHAREWPSAMQHLREAIRLRPDFAAAYLELGLTLRASGALADAVASIRKATALDPNDAHFQYQLGLALLDAKKAREASTALIRAASISPENEAIQDALATALAEIRSPKRADPSTAQRPEGSFTGDLKLFSVAELLDFLLNQRATGVLIVRAPSGEGRVELYQGAIVGTRHPGGKPFGQRLIENDLVSQTDLKQAAISPQDLEHDGRLASILAARKLVSDELLTSIFYQHAQIALRDMLNWNTGDVVFQKELSHWATPPSVRVDTRFCLLEAIRWLDEQRADATRRP